MIDLSKPRYDQSTYWGRLKHFSEITDPRNLLNTNAQIENAKSLVQDYKAGKFEIQSKADEEKLWKAKRLLDSTIHPDTGEKIFLPFRMAGFVPTNVLIVAGMLMPNPSTASIIFWQWTNQSINVAFNYFNANKTTEMNMTETATAYSMAVASSCTIAVGLSALLKRSQSRFTPSTFSMLSKAVPFAAVAAAGTANVVLMRRKELVDGIDVYNRKGELLGKSTAAGSAAVSQVAVSRVATAFPAVFLPGIVMSQLEKMTWIKRNPSAGIALNLLTITASLMAALPCAVAIFPQEATLKVSSLEPKLAKQLKEKGEDVVYFNRGL
ncbi:hypothetical protein HK098_003348 [Nowakowskiella sp. JEL0407]|nr:hypothetical protein HK098_003348 [Nowakowskiella sp. JEL0407]